MLTPTDTQNPPTGTALQRPDWCTSCTWFSFSLRSISSRDGTVHLSRGISISAAF